VVVQIFTYILRLYVLTCLGCSDIDDHRSSGGGAEVGDSVLALNSEAVVGVRLQVGDQHAG